MKVGELIEKLLQMPQDAEVNLVTDNDYEGVGKVKLGIGGDVIIVGDDEE